MKNLSVSFMMFLYLFFSGNGLEAQHLNLDGTLALQGYDALSYFQSKPMIGSKKFQVSYKGAIYRFVNEENQQEFKKNPEKYVPAYGGWCAYAMGNTGEKVSVNPETFKVIDGKLYLFYNKFFTNTLNSWNENEKNLKAAADKNWNKIVNK